MNGTRQVQPHHVHVLMRDGKPFCVNVHSEERGHGVTTLLDAGDVRSLIADLTAALDVLDGLDVDVVEDCDTDEGRGPREPRVLQYGDPCPEVGSRWRDQENDECVVIRHGRGSWVCIEGHSQPASRDGWAWNQEPARRFPMTEVLP